MRPRRRRLGSLSSPSSATAAHSLEALVAEKTRRVERTDWFPFHASSVFVIEVKRSHDPDIRGLNIGVVEFLLTEPRD